MFKGPYIILLLSLLTSVFAQYKIGVGRADCTGPAAEVTLMGYAKSSQKSCGIHLRQFARAFIFDDGVKRAAFVSVDMGMMAYGVRKKVLDRLNKSYGDVYTESNVILSGTHTHCAPGGFMMDFMYDIPNLGFVRETFDAFVDGITRSIVRAHENMVDGKIFISSGELLGISINRSPMAYLLNPEEERSKYKYDVDKEMVQLKLLSTNDTLLGVINWFAVHATSMNYSNCLISSDNVGYASILLEKSQNKHSLVGQGSFVGAFASSNLGDVTPNIKGPRCTNTGQVCDMIRSTCDGEGKYCLAAGPGNNMFDSTGIIAEKLLEKANILLNSKDSREVFTPLRYIHRYVDMPKETATITLSNGTVEQVHGCLPAMGYSFAAGTIDGFGEFDFHQGTRSANRQWDTLRDFLCSPTQEEIDCQHPKPILINTGRMTIPYQWQSHIVSTQLIQLGDVFLAAVPGEFTTMSGRRLRNAITDTLINNGCSRDTKVVITGLSNIYTSYIATPEEYQMQRYEGASTIFGPHTLTLYLNIYKKLAEALVRGEKISPGPSPPDLSHKLVSLDLGVIFDTSGFEHNFGDCIIQPPSVVRRGTPVIAKFVSAHPRNDVMQEKTFLTVEKLNRGNWSVVATDADWETKFVWSRSSNLIGGSEAIIQWVVPDDASPGTYRIRHFGNYKAFLGGVNPYNGSSNNFDVVE